MNKIILIFFCLLISHALSALTKSNKDTCNKNLFSYEVKIEKIERLKRNVYLIYAQPVDTFYDLQRIISIKDKSINGTKIREGDIYKIMTKPYYYYEEGTVMLRSPTQLFRPLINGNKEIDIVSIVQLYYSPNFYGNYYILQSEVDSLKNQQKVLRENVIQFTYRFIEAIRLKNDTLILEMINNKKLLKSSKLEIEVANIFLNSSYFGEEIQLDIKSILAYIELLLFKQEDCLSPNNICVSYYYSANNYTIVTVKWKTIQKRIECLKLAIEKNDSAMRIVGIDFFVSKTLLDYYPSVEEIYQLRNFY